MGQCYYYRNCIYIEGVSKNAKISIHSWLKGYMLSNTDSFCLPHTVLTINKFFRQIEAKNAILASKLTLQNAHFWEKVIVPTRSYKGVENEFCPKFSKLWCKSVFGRGNARIWMQLAISFNPMLKEFHKFKEISKFDQLWSPIMRFQLDF